MKRSEREELIERFLREEMTTSEEHDFFIEAATDRELRFDLKASRVVESAFRKDRDTMPSSYSTMRDHFAGLLAARSAEPVRYDAGSGSASSGFGGMGVGWLATAASIGLVSLAALLIGIVAINKGNDLDDVRRVPTITIEQGPVDAVQPGRMLRTPEGLARTADSQARAREHSTSNGAEQSTASATKSPATLSGLSDTATQQPPDGGESRTDQPTPAKPSEATARDKTKVDSTHSGMDGPLEFDIP